MDTNYRGEGDYTDIRQLQISPVECRERLDHQAKYRGRSRDKNLEIHKKIADREYGDKKNAFRFDRKTFHENLEYNNDGNGRNYRRDQKDNRTNPLNNSNYSNANHKGYRVNSRLHRTIGHTETRVNFSHNRERNIISTLDIRTNENSYRHGGNVEKKVEDKCSEYTNIDDRDKNGCRINNNKNQSDICLSNEYKISGFMNFTHSIKHLETNCSNIINNSKTPNGEYNKIINVIDNSESCKNDDGQSFDASKSPSGSKSKVESLNIDGTLSFKSRSSDKGKHINKCKDDYGKKISTDNTSISKNKLDTKRQSSTCKSKLIPESTNISSRKRKVCTSISSSSKRKLSTSSSLDIKIDLKTNCEDDQLDTHRDKVYDKEKTKNILNDNIEEPYEGTEDDLHFYECEQMYLRNYIIYRIKEYLKCECRLFTTRVYGLHRSKGYMGRRATRVYGLHRSIGYTGLWDTWVEGLHGSKGYTGLWVTQVYGLHRSKGYMGRKAT